MVRGPHLRWGRLRPAVRGRRIRRVAIHVVNPKSASAIPTPTKASRSRRRTSTRERILDAALALFVERGVSGTTVSDIERAVGLAAGTGSFYRHFRSKEDLVVPAFERGITEIAKQLEVDRAEEIRLEDPRDRALAGYRSMLRGMQRINPLWLLLLTERDQHPELQDVFIDALGMRQWDLRWDRDQVRTIIIAALTGFHQLAMLDRVYYGTIDPAEFVVSLVELTEARTRDRGNPPRDPR